MTESKAKKELCAHIEYLKHNWKPHPDYDVLEAINIAINALEKQIPKKPIFDNYHRAGYRCPDCNNTNPWGYKHCKHCGQKLDWSDTD